MTSRGPSDARPAAWMIVPASSERFDGVRDFASHLAGALSDVWRVQRFTTQEDAAPAQATVVSTWKALPSRVGQPQVVLVNYMPQAWLRRDTRALLTRLSAAGADGARIILIVHEYQLDPARSITRAAAQLIFRALARAFASRAHALVATHGFVAEWARADGLDRHAVIATIPAGSNIADADARPSVQANQLVMFGQPAGMAPSPVAEAVALLSRRGITLVWICRREDEARAWMARHVIPQTAVRIAAGLDEAAVSRELSRAAIGFAPIVDGVSTRRTTVAALLQHRLPVVGTDGRATDALFRDSEAFVLAPVGDGAAAARSIERLLDEPQRRDRMAVAARALFDAHLAWPRIAAAYVRLAS